MHNIDEPIHIVDHDQAWPKLFLSERARICACVGYPPERVEHIGSTAVLDLPAKPVIDIMVGVDGWPPMIGLVGAIAGLGYEVLGEAGVPERLYFRIRRATSFNLHVVRFNGKHWRSNLALRDYLRSNKDARNRYGRTKRAVISSGASTLLAYSDAKSSIVTTLVKEALAAASER